MVINSVHESPVFTASTGHQRIAITRVFDSAPLPGPPGAAAQPRLRRAQAKAIARARREEIRRGAPFLSFLTTNLPGQGQAPAATPQLRSRELG